MKQFISKISVFFGIFVLICIFGHYLTRQPESGDPNDFLAAIIDKHQRLESFITPVTIFAGGSNLAYGLDSVMLENELHTPVVNLALHAGLGLSFILEELKQSIKTDDTVYLSLEYFLDLDGSYDLKKRAIGFFPRADRYFKRNLLQETLLNLIYLQETTRNNISRMDLKSAKTEPERKPGGSENRVYSRKSFNQAGDVIAHLEKPSKTELASRRIFQYQFWPGISELNAFQQYASQRGVKVFFMFPGYARSEYDKNRVTITRLAADLAAHLQIPILGTPEDFVFDDSCFYDTVYHLNKAGREKRTQKILKLIR